MPKQQDLTQRRRKEGQFLQVMRRLSRNRSAMLGLGLVLLLVLAAILSPWIMPYDYTKMDILSKYAGPGGEHLFGCDELGRDVFSRCLYGARASLSLGLLATLISTLVGVVLGSLVGYFGGWVDTVIMRLLDILQTIPGMLLSIAISAALGSGFGNTIIALSIGGVPMTVRLLRGSILTVRKQEYIEAAEKINCSRFRVITSHILPNSIAPLIVSVTMGIGNTILQAASLSYIGLGVPVPQPSWGMLAQEGASVFQLYPHQLWIPAIAISLTMLSFNLLGDGLRDAFDPRLRR